MIVFLGLTGDAALGDALAEPRDAGAGPLPTLREALASGRDLWGEAAMRQPDGPSHEFFEPLLPPPRYVHADFRSYPLVLSAPGAAVKARLVSNGSGVNLRGGSRSWKDVGTPVVFRVGPDEFQFGGLRERVSDPSPAEGWLPIYAITYRHPFPVQAEGLVPIDQKPVEREAEVYRLEAFVSTDPALADHAVVFVRFSLEKGARGIVAVELDPRASSTFLPGRIRNGEGETVVHLDRSWRWERQAARADLAPGRSATLAIATRPLPEGRFTLDEGDHDRHRANTTRTWTERIAPGMHVAVPERRVENAWRSLLVQNFMISRGDRLNYSAANQYEAIYVGEGSDAALAMMAWGFEADAARFLRPILAFTRKGLEHHQAGIKLLDIRRYWWQTRDAGFVADTRRVWQKDLDRLLADRSAETHLLPLGRYCGDIATRVHSLSVEAKAWRALQDLPPVLRALDDQATAERVARAAAELRPRLTDIVLRSARRETDPPFIPIALLDREQVHSPITATRIGSYWNIINGFVIASRLFPSGSSEEMWLPRYVENHGGLFMGMTRSGGTAHGFWTGSERVNPLYGTRYVLDTLRRDDPERALASFYGMLAQGMTRETFVGGEGCTLEPVDPGGRFFYCPPNTAANAHVLSILRDLLVQDADLDGDGAPETLRLAFATSRRWLGEGKSIVVERAPTAFGPVSYRLESRLERGEVRARVELPRREAPRVVLLRARVPSGWRVVSAEVAGKARPVDASGAVDLSDCRGDIEARFAVAPR